MHQTSVDMPLRLGRQSGCIMHTIAQPLQGHYVPLTSGFYCMHMLTSKSQGGRNSYRFQGHSTHHMMRILLLLAMLLTPECLKHKTYNLCNMLQDVL